jgi:hypothetical protein
MVNSGTELLSLSSTGSLALAMTTVTVAVLRDSPTAAAGARPTRPAHLDP